MIWRNFKKNITIGIVIFIVAGCTNVSIKNRNKDIFIFDLKDLDKTSIVKLLDLDVIDIEYIPLQKDENALLGEFYELKADSHFFYINTDGKIYKYSSTGNYITQIGKKGKGPGEYNFCTDFAVDYNQNVYILSMHEDKIFIYSPDGNFVKTIPCPKNSTKLHCFERDILCFSENSYGLVENSFDLINYNGEIIKSFPNKFKCDAGRSHGLFLNECAFFESEGKLYIKEISSDTIFVYENMNFFPEFIFSQGERSIPPEERNWNSFDDFMKTASKYVSIWKLFQFGDFIYYEFRFKGKGYIFIGSKKNNQQLLANQNNGLINDLDGGPNIWLKTTKDDNTAISWINAFELKAHVASEAFKNSTPKYPEKKKELEKLANSLKENDNPVLMLVRLKE